MLCDNMNFMTCQGYVSCDRWHRLAKNISQVVSGSYQHPWCQSSRERGRLPWRWRHRHTSRSCAEEDRQGRLLAVDVVTLCVHCTWPWTPVCWRNKTHWSPSSCSWPNGGWPRGEEGVRALWLLGSCSQPQLPTVDFTVNGLCEHMMVSLLSFDNFLLMCRY